MRAKRIKGQKEKDLERGFPKDLERGFSKEKER